MFNIYLIDFQFLQILVQLLPIFECLYHNYSIIVLLLRNYHLINKDLIVSSYIQTNFYQSRSSSTVKFVPIHVIGLIGEL